MTCYSELLHCGTWHVMHIFTYNMSDASFAFHIYWVIQDSCPAGHDMSCTFSHTTCLMCHSHFICTGKWHVIQDSCTAGHDMSCTCSHTTCLTRIWLMYTSDMSYVKALHTIFSTFFAIQISITDCTMMVVWLTWHVRYKCFSLSCSSIIAVIRQ